MWMTEEESQLRVDNGEIELAFSSNGKWTGLFLCSSRERLGEAYSFIGATEEDMSFNLQIDGKWLSSQGKPRLKGVRKAGKGRIFVAEFEWGDLGVELCYFLKGTRVGREMGVANRGSSTIRLTGARLTIPQVLMGEAEVCTFEAPGNPYKPRTLLLEQLAQGLDVEPVEVSPGFYVPRRFWDAPDFAPGLLAIHNGELRLTLMSWYFSWVEPAQLYTRSDGNGISLIYEPQVAGWLEPGQNLRFGIISEGVQKGIIRPLNPQVAAQALVGMLDIFLVQHSSDDVREKADMGKVFPEAFGIYWNDTELPTKTLS